MQIIMPATTAITSKRPKYVQVAQHLRHQIERGELRPGDRLPSITEMCNQHGVSRPVVERIHSVLEQDGLVVRKPNRGIFVASARPSKRTNVIGITGWGVQQQPSTWYWTSLVEGIQEVANRAGQHIMLLDPQLSRVNELVDGVLLTDLPAEEQSRRLPADFPCVSILHPVRGRASVLADDYCAGQLATEHLLELGHRRIACIDIPEHISRRRLAAYRDTLESAGIIPDMRWVRPFGVLDAPTPNFEERGQAIMAQWLRDDWQELGCTAILAQNDLVAKGVMKALQAEGIHVPRSVSVIGFDSSEFCEHLSPRLTSVAIPLREMGALGMELLLRQIEGEPVLAANTALPPRLDVRESTGPAKSGHGD